MGFQSEVLSWLREFIDIDFTLWITWLLAPLIVTFLLPAVIALLLYAMVAFLYIYKLHWNRLRGGFNIAQRWDYARRVVAACWDAHGWIWHGYEIKGTENIPLTGGALFIYYHGAIPIDLYYFMSKLHLQKNTIINLVADYFLFKIPGFSIIAECIGVIPGTVQTCSNILKDGGLLAISPGGVYEAQFSHDYQLMWRSRVGFAKAAIDGKVPIIPMYTENLREAFRTVSFGSRFFFKLYMRTRFPFVPIFGGFPVKLITHVGKPIPYDPDLTPEQLRDKVALALNELIEKHQRKPASILAALLDRIAYFRGRHKKET